MFCNCFYFRSDAEDPDLGGVGAAPALGVDAESSAIDESSDDDDAMDSATISSQISVKDMNISAGSFLCFNEVFDALTFNFLPDSITPPSVQSGSLVVRRLPLLPLLRCKASTDILWRPFVSPCASMRTQESDVLLRKKTLGVRRVRSLVPAAFSPVSPPKDDTSDPKLPESPQETFESDFVRHILFLHCTLVTVCAGSVGRRGHRGRGSATHMRRQHAVQAPARAPARGCAVHVRLCDGFPGLSGKWLYSRRRHGPWQDFAGCNSAMDFAYSGYHGPVNMSPWPCRVSHISRTPPQLFSVLLLY
jgi:hypothetical protein